MQDRMAIHDMYPKSANLADQVLVKAIKTQFEMTEKDKEDVDFKFVKEFNSYKWDPNKDKGKEIELTSKAVSLLQNIVDKLDKKKQITQAMVDLCIKINELK